MKNIETLFPNEIDPRIYFSDCSLDKLSVKEKYDESIQFNNEKNIDYIEANKTLNDNDIDYVGAWLFNLLENRLAAIGEYLLTISTDTPHIVYHQNNEPEIADIGTGWIY